MAEVHEAAELTVADREHLTLYFYNHANDYTLVAVPPRTEWLGSDRVYTVDTAADYAVLAALAERFDAPLFSVSDLVALERAAP